MDLDAQLKGYIDDLNKRTVERMRASDGSKSFFEGEVSEDLARYNAYMLTTFPQEPHDQWNMCVDFCARMQKDFPELKIIKGLVWSFENEDNPHPKYPVQYPHCWLETPNGKRIDPTVKQYSLLGELVYYVPGYVINARCRGCGQYHGNGHYKDCGRCEWSK